MRASLCLSNFRNEIFFLLRKWYVAVSVWVSASKIVYGLSSPLNIVQDLVCNNSILRGKTHLFGGNYLKTIPQSWVIKQSLFSQIH